MTLRQLYRVHNKHKIVITCMAINMRYNSCWLTSLTTLELADQPTPLADWHTADWLKNGCRSLFVGACDREACAQKTTNQPTATAIFKPVSRPPISQWRKADQPIPMA